jgi:phosphatidylserine decarboxylase
MKHFYEKTKAILLCSALFFSIIITAEAKSHYPLQPTSVWRVDSVDARWKIVENTRYFFNGDTLIGNVNFFKLYKSGVAQYDKPFYYDNVYVGAVRDENDKIFFIKKKKTVETLLFNFNLNVGDTIKSQIGKGKIIISIDTLQNGRRVFYHNRDHYNLGYFVEGIGSNGGLFSTGSSFITLHSGQLANYLICYSENNSLVFESEMGRVSNCEIVNTNRKFPVDPTSIWRIDCDSDYYVSPYSARYQYYIKGDTTVNQVPYNKLYKAGFYLAPGDDGVFKSSYRGAEYIGALRDYNGKYFFVEKGSNNEKVMYDFNLKVGDRVTSEIYKGEIVYAIDTLYDNRKIFYLGNDRYSKIIIEGIGCTSDFIKGVNKRTYLQCFSVGDIPVYHFAVAVDCRLDLRHTTFYACDQLLTWPLMATSNNNISFEFATCFPISAESKSIPVLSSYAIHKDEYTFDVNLYYINNNTEDVKGAIVPYTVFDTISIGKLPQGQYVVHCNVNSIRNTGTPDTTYNEKSYARVFWVWQSTGSSASIKTGTSDVQIYPVPAKEKVTIKLTDPSAIITSYELYGLDGNKVAFQKFDRPGGLSYFDIDTKTLHSGIYVLKINKGNSFTTHKIIIEK